MTRSHLGCGRKRLVHDELHVCRRGAMVDETSAQGGFAANSRVRDVDTAALNNAWQDLCIVLPANTETNRTQADRREKLQAGVCFNLFRQHLCVIQITLDGG